jgi:hypothetical protein
MVKVLLEKKREKEKKKRKKSCQKNSKSRIRKFSSGKKLKPIRKYADSILKDHILNPRTKQIFEMKNQSKMIEWN